MFEFTINTPDISKFVGRSYFNEFYEIMAVMRVPYEQEIKKLLQDYARDGHRQSKGRHYQNRTGQLRDATRAEGTFGHELNQAIRLYVDQSQAEYAGWIIKGHRKGKHGMVIWNGGHGDPFINEAIEALKPEIDRLVIDLYNKAIAEWNRTKKE